MHYSICTCLDSTREGCYLFVSIATDNFSSRWKNDLLFGWQLITDWPTELISPPSVLKHTHRLHIPPILALLLSFSDNHIAEVGPLPLCPFLLLPFNQIPHHHLKHHTHQHAMHTQKICAQVGVKILSCVSACFGDEGAGEGMSLSLTEPRITQILSAVICRWLTWSYGLWFGQSDSWRLNFNMFFFCACLFQLHLSTFLASLSLQRTG